MFENRRWQRPGAANIFALAILACALPLCWLRARPLLESDSRKSTVHSCVCRNASFVVERGVISLRQRTPGAYIRGMLDTENADLGLNEFTNAALQLAPERNAGAEFILGWVCANGDFHLPSTTVYKDLSLHPIDYNKLGLTADQRLAAQWYVLASIHGSSAASIAMGNMIENSYEEDHEKNLAVAAHFYQMGMLQGDIEARIHLARSYAYGRGVKADANWAWKELEDVMKTGDTENSICAIVVAMEAWKDKKLSPPAVYTRGAKNAYEFANRYDMKGAQLDELYTDPGCVPNPYPQFRRDLGIQIREDWLPTAKS